MLITREEFFEKVGHINRIDKQKQDKLSYYAMKLVKLFQKIIKDHNEKVDMINIDFCSVDELGNIIYSGTGNTQAYVYTKENAKTRAQKLKELMKEPVEITPCLCPDLNRVKSLDWDIQIALDGILWEVGDLFEYGKKPEQLLN